VRQGATVTRDELDRWTPGMGVIYGGRHYRLLAVDVGDFLAAGDYLEVRIVGDRNDDEPLWVLSEYVQPDPHDEATRCIAGWNALSTLPSGFFSSPSSTSYGTGSSSPSSASEDGAVEDTDERVLNRVREIGEVHPSDAAWRLFAKAEAEIVALTHEVARLNGVVARMEEALRVVRSER
jgi:hypothetical protein